MAATDVAPQTPAIQVTAVHGQGHTAKLPPRRPRAERRALAQKLMAIVGEKYVFWDDYDLMLYQYDGSIDIGLPDAIALPSSAEQVQAIVRLARAEGVPIVARGAGTGLSGGCIPLEGGIVLSFARMNRILEIDLENLRAVVEPGVVNLHLSQRVAPHRLYFVPDPSSQKACTIGGNVGENSGGPHTLCYGVTTNHVLGLECVLPDGELVRVGGKALDGPGYDLTGVIVGSEGTLAIVTKIWVKLVALPEAVKTLLAIFNTVEDASNTVSAIIAGGVIPAALEMMDHLTIQAVEQSVHAGYPLDAGAVLLIELEGLREEIEVQAEAIVGICEQHHAREVRVARSARERDLLWAGRKGAFGALGRISPDFYVMDGVIPRSRLPEVLRRIDEVGAKYGFRVANVFHAGDGNLHPNLLFDSDRPGELERVREAGAEIIRICAEAGGSLSGEHGIGVEKRDLMPLIFSEADLATMKRLKHAFDPDERFNPGKVFPVPGACVGIVPRTNMQGGW